MTAELSTAASSSPSDADDATSEMPPEVVEQWPPLPPPSVALTAASGYAALSALHAAVVRLMHDGVMDSNGRTCGHSLMRSHFRL